ncbi:MAG: AraC family transcriptional regulator [Ruminococcaceae bacterium]|nr:AraC family transcriptional regulator [Oscillospiraceae bacterium]
MAETSYFSIDRIKRSKKYEMKTDDFHDHYELYYLISGERKYFVGHSICTVNPGDFILIDKHVLHKTSPISSDVHERYLISFNDKFLRKFISENSMVRNLLKCFDKIHISVPYEKRKQIGDILVEIMNEYRRDDEYSEYVIFSLFTELMVTLNRICDEDTVPTVMLGKYEANIQRVVDFLNVNFRDNITLAQAAEMAYTGSTYFSKKFKKCTGFGFSEYLTYLRINEASKMLVSTKESISDISSLCGFNNSSYFGDVFKKIKGVSPQRYRSMYLGTSEI